MSETALMQWVENERRLKMKKREPKIEVFRVHIRKVAGRVLGAGFHWRLRGANGEIVCGSSGDPSPLKRGATARARRACQLMAERAGFPCIGIVRPSIIKVEYV